MSDKQDHIPVVFFYIRDNAQEINLHMYHDP